MNLAESPPKKTLNFVALLLQPGVFAAGKVQCSTITKFSDVVMWSISIHNHHLVVVLSQCDFWCNCPPRSGIKRNREVFPLKIFAKENFFFL